MSRARLWSAVFAFALGAVAFAEPVVKGPERGALVIVGGGKVGTDILGRLFDLAGGKDAPRVVIPTANGQDDFPGDWPGTKMFTKYFFMGPGEKYDLTKLERIGKPARSEP